MKYPIVHQAKLVMFLLGLVCLYFLQLACNLGSIGAKGVVTAIQSPDQETVVAYTDRLTLVVPANTVPRGSQVSIQAITDAQAHEFSGLQTLAAYDITIGDLATFQNPLELKIKYDPARLRKDVEAKDQVFVAYLDKTSQRWVEVGYSLDGANATVTIQTDHLSLWSIFGLDADTTVSYSPHFKIYFSEKLNAPLLGKTVSGAGLIYDFAAHVRTGLGDAYDRYASPQGDSGTGFKIPDQTNVYIDDWGAEKTAEWGWFSKNIEIPITYSNLDELNQDSAHELFHAIQNQYVRVPAMVKNRWWIEATADYAAAYIGTNNGLRTALALDFIKKSLDDSEEKHAYRVAHFIDYLNQEGIDFKDLFEATMLSGDDVLAAVDTHVSSKGVSLADLYSDFAFSFIFGGRIKHETPVSDVPAQLADITGEYSRADETVSHLVDVPQHYATRLAAFKITDDPDVAFPVYLSALEQTNFVQVHFVIASSASPDSIIQVGVLEGGQREKVQVRGGNYVYFMVTNSGDSAGSVSVVIEQPAGVNSYTNDRTAKIYNGYYIANMSLSVISSHEFKVVSEQVAPNGETLVLDIRLATGLKPDEAAVITVEAQVSDLELADPAAHPNLTASIRETNWVLPGGTNASGGSATTTITAGSTEAATLMYEVYINTFNSLDNSEAQAGSGVMVILHIIP
ncbi:MAG: hypothetical protein EHM70_15885 [Chloroflexota bacterium]|nr:MAG: hypothetical protein EHM70_15885 [Chloroflexota bacterium]